MATVNPIIFDPSQSAIYNASTVEGSNREFVNIWSRPNVPNTSVLTNPGTRQIRYEDITHIRDELVQLNQANVLDDALLRELMDPVQPLTPVARPRQERTEMTTEFNTYINPDFQVQPIHLRHSFEDYHARLWRDSNSTNIGISEIPHMYVRDSHYGAILGYQDPLLQSLWKNWLTQQILREHILAQQYAAPAPAHNDPIVSISLVDASTTEVVMTVTPEEMQEFVKENNPADIGCILRPLAMKLPVEVKDIDKIVKDREEAAALAKQTAAQPVVQVVDFYENESDRPARARRT